MITLTSKQHSLLVIFILLLLVKLCHYLIGDITESVNFTQFILITIAIATLLVAIVWSVILAWTTIFTVKD